MEDKLKNILKKHATFAEMSTTERLQLVEWCADEQEFQSLKKLFQQVDAWSDQPTDHSNTKLRLDQLFSIQYAGKQAASNGKEIQFTKNRFSRVATWTSISAVAASLVLTWFVYQPEKEVHISKNQTKPSVKEKHFNVEKKEVLTEKTIENISKVPTETSNVLELREFESMDGRSSDLTESIADVETVVPDVTWSSSLANGSTAALTSANLNAASYAWTVGNLSEIQVESSKIAFKEKVSSRKKQADSFTSFNVKSMPEMLDVIVSAY